MRRSLFSAGVTDIFPIKMSQVSVLVRRTTVRNVPNITFVSVRCGSYTSRADTARCPSVVARKIQNGSAWFFTTVWPRNKFKALNQHISSRYALLRAQCGRWCIQESFTSSILLKMTFVNIKQSLLNSGVNISLTQASRIMNKLT